MNSKKIIPKTYLDVPDFYSTAEQIKRAMNSLPDWREVPQGLSSDTPPQHKHLDQDWENILQEVVQRSHISKAQAKDLHYAIELLNTHDVKRASFWKHYLQHADKAIPKKGRKEVAVAFFFQNIVIVEFAPSGHAAYIYRKDVFTTKVMKLIRSRFSVLGWKNKKFTHLIPGITSENGTFHHRLDWQRKLGRFLNILVRREK